MSVSQAVANPSKGTIRVSIGADDEGTELPTEHDLAPWPVDGHCESIAQQALSGMGWTVLRTHPIPNEPDAGFVMDVAPKPE